MTLTPEEVVMVTRRHPTKRQTRSFARGGQGGPGHTNSSSENPYIPVFIFIGLFAFLALMLVIKIYNEGN